LATKSQERSQSTLTNSGLNFDTFEPENITIKLKIFPIISNSPTEVVVPIGTKSMPKGISDKTSDMVVVYQGNKVWYATKESLQEYISENSSKLEFFLDKENYNTMCIKFPQEDVEEAFCATK